MCNCFGKKKRKNKKDPDDKATSDDFESNTERSRKRKASPTVKNVSPSPSVTPQLSHSFTEKTARGKELPTTTPSPTKSAATPPPGKDASTKTVEQQPIKTPEKAREDSLLKGDERLSTDPNVESRLTYKSSEKGDASTTKKKQRTIQSIDNIIKKLKKITFADKSQRQPIATEKQKNATGGSKADTLDGAKNEETRKSTGTAAKKNNIREEDRNNRNDAGVRPEGAKRKEATGKREEEKTSRTTRTAKTTKTTKTTESKKSNK